MDDRESQSVDKRPSILELSDEHADTILLDLFGRVPFEEAQKVEGFLPRLRTALKIALADPSTRPLGHDVPDLLLVRGHIWAQLGRQDLASADFNEDRATDFFRKEVASVLSPDTSANMRREYLDHITRMLERMPLEAFRRFDYAREMWIIANRHNLQDSVPTSMIRPDAQDIVVRHCDNFVILLDDILNNQALQAFDKAQRENVEHP